ncbi:hypothetical protein A8709_18965 [Paenibacillus pectinilyticus]|uniref:Copper amine oxidase-like N-terminal domain-containing protein n=1 Tax=Paenibacillus pectinilyticus TaxID=512399 RepID=A0A1C0ZZY5_9BACL|nr:stalk domain-containing protein [Paenibacillus pectinilyticus]OCT13670.1 hypothetical protein A8709_18965 [Paenibacillus pectinilyticus]
MKKFIFGLSCGLMIAGSTAAFASDSIQALLFPARFEINGSAVDLGKDYQVLNVDGHAYVPVRFVAENLGANIDYDTDSQKIVIQNRPLDITDPDYKTISVGNLILTKDGDNTKVTGQLKFDGVGITQNSINALLTFYNEDNVKIGDVTISGDDFGVDAKTFVTEGKGDFRKYDAAYLNIRSVNQKVILDEPTTAYTDTKLKYSLNLPKSWMDNYRIGEMLENESNTANIHFYDRANLQYGGILFSISIWTKSDWINNGPTAKSIARLYILGEDEDRVFVMSLPGDVQFNPHDAQLTAGYKEMSDQIGKIRTSLKFVK